MRAIEWALLAALAAGQAGAGELRVRTEIGATALGSDADSLAAALGYGRATALTGQARLMFSDQKGPVSGEIHLLLAGASGSAVGLSSAAATDTPPATLFDLTATLADEKDAQANATLDRAYLSFTSDHLVLTVGRQAITWGAGYFFRPMDIVAPFPPDAIDTSYKPGVDMVYAQVLFDSGADIQAIWVPRPATAGGDIDPQASTWAAYGSAALGKLEAHLLAARDRGMGVTGLGLAGPLKGAAWNLEWVGLEAGGSVTPSWLANISNFATIGGKNVSYYAEVYHNGLGVAPNVALDALPADLANRMATGQVFFPGGDFLGLGAQVQMTDTTTVSPSVIVATGDGSALFSLGVDWSLGDNADLHLDLSAPSGGARTEFGGRETSAGSGIYAQTPRQAVLRYVRYF